MQQQACATRSTEAFDLVIRGWSIRLVRTRDFVWLWTASPPRARCGPRGGRPYLFGLVGVAGEVVTTAAPPGPVLDDCLHLALLAARHPRGGVSCATTVTATHPAAMLGWTEAALAAYFTVSGIKALLRLAGSRFRSLQAEHPRFDYAMRLLSILAGILWALVLVPAPSVQWAVATGALAGLSAVPVYHGIKASSGRLGGRWAVLDQIIALLLGPSVGPGARPKAMLESESEESEAPPAA